ncbi:MAG: hypothetical protein LC802_13815 [Acidobacteria bacterium]|nr:hypothetical protein [Acidobacteriota bacterium]
MLLLIRTLHVPFVLPCLSACEGADFNSAAPPFFASGALFCRAATIEPAEMSSASAEPQIFNKRTLFNSPSRSILTTTSFWITRTAQTLARLMTFQEKWGFSGQQIAGYTLTPACI